MIGDMIPSILSRSRSNDIVNPGISRRRGQRSEQYRQTKLAVYVLGFLILYVLGTTIYQSHFAGMFVPDIEVDETGRARVRRRPHRHKQKVDPSKPTTAYDAILEGYLTMIEINIPQNALQGGDAYRGVTGKFCHIDWKLQMNQPYKVPMFNDLIRQSRMCDSTAITVDLWDLAQQAHAYDSQMTQDILPVPPTGVVFHESRCGSTLLANMLAGFSPGHTRVYSENQVHNQVLSFCDKYPCNPIVHKKLIQDIFYLSGRTIRKERPQYVFYKVSSIGSLYLDKFTEAFSSVPWIYLYRDTVEVMQSHLVTKGSTVALSRERPVCLRMQNAPQQPILTTIIAKSKGKEPSALSKEEYCATHLAALSKSAIQEHERTKKGIFVNYAQLPDIMWENLLPNEFKVPINDSMIERMKTISQNYSKARDKKDLAFGGDAELKRHAASPEVVQAAEVFAGDIYKRLQDVSGQGGARH